MNINTIKKFLDETKFRGVNCRTFTWGHNLHHYELFEFMTEDGQTLDIALHKCGLCGKIFIYKNNNFVVCFNNLINKWMLHSYIKKAFSKHFDEVIENWKKEEK